MRVLALFELRDATPAQLARLDEELQRANAASPIGRSMRFCAPAEQGFFIVELWRSEADVDQHAAELVPALIRAGIEPPAPRLYPIDDYDETSHSTRPCGSGS